MLLNNTQEAQHHSGYCGPIDWFPIHLPKCPISPQLSISIYKMQCTWPRSLLQQHLPNLPTLPSRKARAMGPWENHHLQVPLQVMHHPDLEIYWQSFIVAWLISKKHTASVALLEKHNQKDYRGFRKAAH